jgi:hypothetical protein
MTEQISIWWSAFLAFLGGILGGAIGVWGANLTMREEKKRWFADVLIHSKNDLLVKFYELYIDFHDKSHNYLYSSELKKKKAGNSLLNDEKDRLLKNRNECLLINDEIYKRVSIIRP